MEAHDHTEEAAWVLDRIEDEAHAVLVSDRGEEQVVPLSVLPPGVPEGTVLRVSGDGWAPDPEATRVRREQAERRRDSLRRGPSGPISL
jgi:hypothetical protein